MYFDHIHLFSQLIPNHLLLSPNSIPFSLIFLILFSSLLWDLLWRVGYLPGITPLKKKTDLLSPSSYQTPIAQKLGWKSMVTSHPHTGILSGLSLHKSYASCYNHCELVFKLPHCVSSSFTSRSYNHFSLSSVKTPEP